MRIFTVKEIEGQWSNENVQITFYTNLSMKLFKTNHFDILYEGDYLIFDQYIILRYKINNIEVNETVKIVELKNKMILLDLSQNPGLKIELSKTFFDESLIKQLNFEKIDAVRISDIKQELQIPIFHFNTAKTKDGIDTNFFRHWEKEQRIAILIEKKLAQRLKDDKDILLTAEKTIRKGALGFYNNVKIIEYDDNEYPNFDLREIYDDYSFNNQHNDLRGF